VYGAARDLDAFARQHSDLIRNGIAVVVVEPGSVHWLGTSDLLRSGIARVVVEPGSVHIGCASCADRDGDVATELPCSCSRAS
jgi:hypothetical protein